jgi:hypothetical protein
MGIMRHKRLFFILFLLACLSGFQNDPLTIITQKLSQWALEQPVEKVYLQLDKPYYAAGDDAWFKAYVVSGSDHHPTTVSGIVNVELVDADDSVKQSIKLRLVQGSAHGDFALPDTLHPGRYYVRAYTQYMRNAGSDYFFNTPITILNSRYKVNVHRFTNGKPDLQFFPEGGYMVNGIASKIAFKAVGPTGLGIAVNGTVTDNAGNTVTSFASSHLGMGTLEMTPRAGMSYKATVNYADGSQSIVSMPQAMANGSVLAISYPDTLHMEVKVSSSLAQPLLLVAQNAGKIYYSTELQGGKSFVKTIDISRFPSGILQLTLFKDIGEPLNERLVFVQNHDQLNLRLSADRPVYAPRQQVKFKLSAGVQGDFSVAVTDENRVPVNDDEADNILASLLLTSDLKGYIERADYYFNRPNAKTRADLDILMLTQGYRRFEWKSLLLHPLPVSTFAAESALQISGTIISATGHPVPQGKVKLFDLDSIRFNRDTITDAQGRFSFNQLDFDDSSRFIIQARTAKNKKNVTIRMDRLAPMAVKKVWNGYSTSDSSLAVFALSSSALSAKQREFGLGNHVISLQEVVIREKKELLKHSTNLNGPGNADQIFMGSELERLGCTRISDCLEGRLTGVTFRGGIPYSTRGYLPMQLIVDGIYVDGGYLRNINYTDVQAIEVLRNVNYTSIYGGYGANGLLLITTKYGGEEQEGPEPRYGRGITTYFPKGYYKARTFYSPRYNDHVSNKQLADLRTTIFWQPELKTGTDGKAEFSFFNAGGKGTYRVVVEGIDPKGHIGRQVYHYQVK